MTLRTKALFAIVLVALLWSTAGLAKIVVRELDPYVAAFLRFFVASIVILPFFLKQKSLHTKNLINDLVPLSLLAAANIFFFYFGLTRSSANAATLIYAGVPLLTALLANRLIGEQITRQKIMGILIGLIGVVFIVLLPVISKTESLSADALGNLSFIAAAIVWSMFTVWSRHATDKQGYSPLTVASMTIFTICIVFFIASLFTFRPEYIPTLSKPSIILLILHLGTFVTVATSVLYLWAVKHSSATTASLQNYVGPIFAILVNVTMLGEPITPAFLLGAALVLMGIVVFSGLKLRRIKYTN